MTLSLQLFGAPVLRSNGTPMALLPYLAVTRSRHHRETLAALLRPASMLEPEHPALPALAEQLETLRKGNSP
ncbi:hypothetical protein KAH43_04115 [Candidatus Bipolaricaulota bacterium]|nr:hypothetical protein [Candidatus Bipolaricaulota bacterium]